MAEVESFELCPGTHFMPEAICCSTDHLPLAHRWKEVPEMQFHKPSGRHEPLKIPELGLELFDEGDAGSGGGT